LEKDRLVGQHRRAGDRQAAGSAAAIDGVQAAWHVSDGLPDRRRSAPPVRTRLDDPGVEHAKLLDATGWSPTFAAGAGQAISTLGDLGRWGRFSLGSDHGWLGHQGSNPGYSADVPFVPARNATIVVLANMNISSRSRALEVREHRSALIEVRAVERSGCGSGVITAASFGDRAGHPARTSPDRWTAGSSPDPPGRPIPQTAVRRDHRYIERTPTNRRKRHMSTTATQTQTQTTVIAKIRNWLRQLRGGQDAMFRYDREFQA
jgi:hypothetical protein